MANYSHNANKISITRTESLELITKAQKSIHDCAGTQSIDPLLEMPLTMQQFRVLTLLHFDPHNNTGAALADKLQVSMATMSGIIDRLESLDMVKRHDDLEDQRIRRILLTVAGETLITEFFDAQDRMISSLLDQLDDDELSHLALGVHALARILSDQTPE